MKRSSDGDRRAPGYEPLATGDQLGDPAGSQLTPPTGEEGVPVWPDGTPADRARRVWIKSRPMQATVQRKMPALDIVSRDGPSDSVIKSKPLINAANIHAPGRD